MTDMARNKPIVVDESLTEPETVVEPEPETVVEPEPETAEVGSVWQVPSGSIIARPDGVVQNVGVGGHTLNLPGTYTCGDRSIIATPAES